MHCTITEILKKYGITITDRSKFKSFIDSDMPRLPHANKNNESLTEVFHEVEKTLPIYDVISLANELEYYGCDESLVLNLCYLGNSKYLPVKMKEANTN